MLSDENPFKVFSPCEDVFLPPLPILPTLIVSFSSSTYLFYLLLISPSPSSLCIFEFVARSRYGTLQPPPPRNSRFTDLYLEVWVEV